MRLHRTTLVGLTLGLAACASSTTAATTAATTTTPTTSPAPASASASTAKKAAATTEAAVAGDIPDDQAFVAYAPGGYTIKVPEGWARTTESTATVFSDKFNTIRIETVTLAAAPTVASVTATDLSAIATAAKGYAVGKVTAVARKAGQAILATYQMDGAANGVTNKTVRLDVERYVFWTSGRAVIVTLSSAVGSDNVDPWRMVTDSFGWAP